MPVEPSSLVWLLEKAWVLLIGWFWYEKKEAKKEDVARDIAISDLKLKLASANYVTEDQVKEAIKEALRPYKEDQQEIKLLLKDLNSNVISLVKDMAVQNAIRSINSSDQTNFTSGNSFQGKS